MGPERQADRDDHDPTAGQWPYAAAPAAELESLRRTHVTAEAYVRSLGTLLLIGAGAIAVVACLSLSQPGTEFGSGWGLWLLVSGFANLAAGLWLRGLDVRGRNLYTAMVVAGLLGRAVTTGLGPDRVDLGSWLFVFELGVDTLFLWLLWNPRAGVVFGRHYREVVIPATPGVERGATLWWVSMACLGLLLMAALGFAALAAVGFRY